MLKRGLERNDLTCSGWFQGNPELPGYGGRKGGGWWCVGSVMERQSRGSIQFIEINHAYHELD